MAAAWPGEQPLPPGPPRPMPVPDGSTQPTALPVLTVLRLQPCGHPAGDLCGCVCQATVDRIELAAAPVVHLTAGRAA